ncbi:MAG: carotenoid biosynthesis protein [Chitinophagaceae bacterium]|nr:carotenoid biosynthesis protein [Chitinophagaceae bacterium]
MNFSKNQIATAIAILFHSIGLIGILFFNSAFIINATSFNLLLSFALILYTQKQKNKYFYFFIFTTAIAGIFVEVIGVNTALLFGEYVYGNVLGVKLNNVPLIIGINWIIIIYCCGVSMQTVMLKVINSIALQSGHPPRAVKALSVIIDGATLAVFFDWIMEPVAIKLGYWQWNADEIPVYNYICWFIISALLLTIFHFGNFNKKNKFAIHLLLIQLMFFLLLRTFL